MWDGGVGAGEATPSGPTMRLESQKDRVGLQSPSAFTLLLNYLFSLITEICGVIVPF